MERRREVGELPGGVPVFLGARDESLMLAFQKGDARAFEVLMGRHRSTVFNFLLRFVGERARADDLTQETWLKVIRSAPNYAPSARFTTWLLTLARNLALDSFRRDRVRHETAERLFESGTEGGVGTPPGPEREAGNLELRAVIERALARLPEEQREVFVLREWAGVAFKEIGEVVGIPEATAKSRMRYALEGMRRMLTEAGFGDREAVEGQAGGAR